MFNQPLIAIDIGSSAIKVIELSGKNNKTLRAIGLETLPAGAVVDGLIQDQETVESVLKELLKKLKIKTLGRRASLSLGGSSVLIKKVGVPKAANQELAEQVYYEAEQHFQADMSELYFDYTEMARSDGGDTPVLLVGAKREMVEQHIAAIRSVGLRAGIVEADVFSIANMFEFNYGVVEGLTALVNVGASSTQVSLIAFGEYLYTRDIPIGGDEYSRQIMESLQVDRDKAEALKVSASQGDQSAPPEIMNLIMELNEQLVGEVQMTIDFFFQSGEAGNLPAVNSLFLTGGGSRILGLDAALAASLQIPVQIINPFQRIEINPKKFQMDYILMQGHLYGVAVGLGMRDFRDTA